MTEQDSSTSFFEETAVSTNVLCELLMGETAVSHGLTAAASLIVTNIFSRLTPEARMPPLLGFQPH